MIRFLRHLSGAFGAFWLTILVISLIRKRPINLDEGVFYAVLAFCALYGLVRASSGNHPEKRIAALAHENAALRARLQHYEPVQAQPPASGAVAPAPLPRAVVVPPDVSRPPQ